MKTDGNRNKKTERLRLPGPRPLPSTLYPGPSSHFQLTAARKPLMMMAGVDDLDDDRRTTGSLVGGHRQANH